MGALIRNLNDSTITGGHIIEPGWVGLNIHNVDGTDQTKSQWVKVGAAATYQIQVTNSEPYSDDCIITGSGSDANWTVSYFDA